MTKTAVVILNWNGISFLKQFLPAVISESTAENTEIIVADNASTDGSVQWLSECYPETRVIVLDKNYGFAGGYNRALEAVTAEYYVLINSDIEVTPRWLEPLIGFLDKNPGYDAVQPKILSYAKRKEFEYAGAAGGFIDRYGYPFCRGRIFNATEEDNGQYDTGKDLFWTSGACMAVRASAWKRCGGFDEYFFAHMEEIDLCWRMKLSGSKLRFIPGSVVFHVGGGALPYESPFKTYLNFRNNLMMLYKNLPEKGFRSVLFIRKSLDGVAALKFLLSGKFRNFRAVLLAHKDYYRQSASLKQKRRDVKKLAVTTDTGQVLNKSIVFQFYIRGRKSFSEIEKYF